jgi:hypothetical protein
MRLGMEHYVDSIYPKRKKAIRPNLTIWQKDRKRKKYL